MRYLSRFWELKLATFFLLATPLFGVEPNTTAPANVKHVGVEQNTEQCSSTDLKTSRAFTVQIPMRDGLELPTDIYFPKNMVDKLPCILVRTPAGRELYLEAFVPMTEAGYVVAIQDTRSKIDPNGSTFPLMSDAWGELQDGYDTVQWLANSSFTNGRIGTMGFSAMGISQLMLAPSAPPALKAQYIGFAASSIYHHAMYMSGRPCKEIVEGWLGKYAKDPKILQYVASQAVYNDFWERFNSNKVASKVNVPALLYAGWYDTFLQGTIDAFSSRQKFGAPGARGAQKLVIGPWTHYWPASMALGDFQIPENGRQAPVDISPKRWFDFYLKGLDTGVYALEPVTYYVMGPLDGSPSSGNVWRTAKKWPIPSVSTRYYLWGQGKLVQENPTHPVTAISYRYDPMDPVLSLGGTNLYIPSGPKDQRPIEGRDDMVIFTSEPLEHDLEVTGQVIAKIYFSSDCPETDISVRLTDVYPDGRSILITDGISSITHHDLIGEKATPYFPGDVRLVEVDLWSTSMVFAKGHRLRVAVTSSNYPRFEKSMNTVMGKKHLGTPPVATNKIHLGGRYQSHIILPVTKRG